MTRRMESSFPAGGLTSVILRQVRFRQLRSGSQGGPQEHLGQLKIFQGKPEPSEGQKGTDASRAPGPRTLLLSHTAPCCPCPRIPALVAAGPRGLGPRTQLGWGWGDTRGLGLLELALKGQGRKCRKGSCSLRQGL